MVAEILAVTGQVIPYDCRLVRLSFSHTVEKIIIYLSDVIGFGVCTGSERKENFNFLTLPSANLLFSFHLCAAQV